MEFWWLVSSPEDEREPMDLEWVRRMKKKYPDGPGIRKTDSQDRS